MPRELHRDFPASTRVASQNRRRWLSCRPSRPRIASTRGVVCEVDHVGPPLFRDRYPRELGSPVQMSMILSEAWARGLPVVPGRPVISGIAQPEVVAAILSCLGRSSATDSSSGAGPGGAPGGTVASFAPPRLLRRDPLLLGPVSIRTYSGSSVVVDHRRPNWYDPDARLREPAPD
jgi:hypothetical protein